jgi:predicted  nucleic acid-binding Zn-ribbon protein
MAWFGHSIFKKLNSTGAIEAATADIERHTKQLDEETSRIELNTERIRQETKQIRKETHELFNNAVAELGTEIENAATDEKRESLRALALHLYRSFPSHH